MGAGAGLTPLRSLRAALSPVAAAAEQQTGPPATSCTLAPAASDENAPPHDMVPQLAGKGVVAANAKPARRALSGLQPSDAALEAAAPRYALRSRSSSGDA